ncbi:MAG: alpha/beta hydrolase [Fusobacteriota bacterium]
MALILSLLGGIFFLVFIGYYFSEKILKIRRRTSEEVYAMELENNSFLHEDFQMIEKEKIRIQSEEGYEIDGYYISLNNKEKRTIIFSHGVGVSKYISVKYMNIFLNRGWNVLIYDHRSHGDTPGKYVTYGYYEKYDLKKIVDWAKNRVGKDIILGIHGESMGAAIAIQYAGMEDGADFYILDCPYSDFREQVKYRLKEDYKLPAFLIVDIANLFLKLRAKFRLEDIKPIDFVKNINSPAFFIHAMEDSYIKKDMTEILYENKPGYKKLYLAENGGHAEAYAENKEEYVRQLEMFFNDIGIDFGKLKV